MDERLKEVFHKIYEGEAKAALRLKIFAKKAEQEDLSQIGKLFRVIAFSEEIHGERALRMLREIKDTDTNLKESFQSETSIAGVAYDHFIEVAEAIGNIQKSDEPPDRRAGNHLLRLPSMRICIRWGLARGLSDMFCTQGPVCGV